MSEVNGYAKGGAGRRRLRETSSSSTSGTSQTGSYDSDQSGDESAAAPLPQRSRLEDARLPVTCHCAKCKGLTTKTAIEAERHIQQWGRHDEGESSRAASGQTMDISALFTPRTSVPASSTMPPPDLARHAQSEPKVEPVVDPMVEPEVEHIMEPTASVESHHPSTEVHGIVGESIVVIERYVAPHRDDGTFGCSRNSPPPMTPPRTRRGRRGSQAADDSLVLHIPSRPY
ncbi:hypothetical protein R1sor_013967 [Riccia sorocarpa]|uniref:Uncharacterized protein n=1 Tax=Riccia sorocarpa TaxID=122646 RepID=A0ABD3H879_9MARC